MVPSAFTASHESSCFGSMCESRVPNGPCPTSNGSISGAVLKLTTSAPQLFRKSRRVAIVLAPVGILSNGAHHAHVRKATTQHAAQRIPDLVVRSVWFRIQYTLRRQNHAAQAVAALCCSFLDKCLLDRMRLFRGSKPFERRDLRLTYRAHRSHAGSCHLSVYHHRARPALRHATTKARSAQFQFIVQDEQQRRLRIDCHGMLAAIHFERDSIHGMNLPDSQA